MTFLVAMVLVVRLLFSVDLVARPKTVTRVIRFDSRRTTLLRYCIVVIMGMCVTLAPA